MRIEERRKEAAKLMAQGFTQSAIAKRLGVSLRTIQGDAAAIKDLGLIQSLPLDASVVTGLDEAERQMKMIVEDSASSALDKIRATQALTEVVRVRESLRDSTSPRGPIEISWEKPCIYCKHTFDPVSVDEVRQRVKEPSPPSASSA